MEKKPPSSVAPAHSPLIRLLIQFFAFIGISGIGWLIDFGCYMTLSYFTDLDVGICNALSAIPGVTFVFFVSTIRLFRQKRGVVPLWGKYVIYIGYQILQLVGISYLNHLIFAYLQDQTLIPLLNGDFGKIAAKILITPITMVLNFIVMKNLIERL